MSRALAVLRLVARAHDDGVRLMDVARDTGLAKGTAHRLLRALSDEGLVSLDPDTRRYRVGVGLMALTAGIHGSHRLVRAARPALERIAAETDDTAYLWVRDGTEAVCLDRREGSFPIRVLTWEPGYRRPLGVGAGSLALLACLSDDEVARVIADTVDQRARFQPVGTPTVQDMIARTRTAGYALAPGLVIDGMTGLGVAVTDGTGQPLAALSVAAVTDRLGQERRIKVAAILQREAAALTRQLAAPARSTQAVRARRPKQADAA